MPRYSMERKQAVLDKLLPPHNLSVNDVARREGISAAALYNWRKKAKQEGRPVPGNRKPTPEDWSAKDKFAVVLETASLNDHELSEYCRSKGLYPEQIERWKDDFIDGMDQSPKVSPNQMIHRKVRKLEREVRRKDKALAEAAALLILQKKFQTLWEDEEN
jgi:transposase-like protein